MSAPARVIFGCLEPALSSWERGFFRDADPWGFILFRRNVETPAQMARLTADLREAVGRDAPILIDQEGGRVARLRPPHWRRWPPPLAFLESPRLDEASKQAALAARYRLIGAELRALGVDVCCAPLLDAPTPEGHDIIGDRALGRSPEAVAGRGRALREGLTAAGVLPVIKHMPGHGRAAADSHERLPVVAASWADLEAHDLPPFKAHADAPLGMTAHVVFTAIDPERPATLSPLVIDRAIRGAVGFDGLLMTDDLSMKALAGDFGARAAQALAAGCDVALHCNGFPEEMTPIAAAVSRLEGASLRRAMAADALRLSLRGTRTDQGADWALWSAAAARVGVAEV